MMTENPLRTNARTSPAQRLEIQSSPETDSAIAKKLGVSRGTVAKWRVRDGVEDLPLGSKTRRSAVPSDENAQFLVALRQLTWGPLQRLLAHVEPVFPGLNRSALYRIWDKWEVGRTPRGAERPHFPFLHHASEPIGAPEPFQLRAFKYSPNSHRGMIFIVGEQSGWLYGETFDSIDSNNARRFIRHVLKEPALLESPNAILRLTTPYNEAFCHETDPDTWHPFRFDCHYHHIELAFATSSPSPIAPLQKGWPDLKPAPGKRIVMKPRRLAPSQTEI